MNITISCTVGEPIKVNGVVATPEILDTAMGIMKMSQRSMWYLGRAVEMQRLKKLLKQAEMKSE